MCKAVQRPILVESLVEAKRVMEAAKKEYEGIQAKLIANMNSAGIKTDDIDGVAKVTMVTTSVLDKVAIAGNQLWLELKAKADLIAADRKEIEKDYKIPSNTPYIKLTLK